MVTLFNYEFQRVFYWFLIKFSLFNYKLVLVPIIALGVKKDWTELLTDSVISVNVRLGIKKTLQIKNVKNVIPIMDNVSLNAQVTLFRIIVIVLVRNKLYYFKI